MTSIKNIITQQTIDNHLEHLYNVYTYFDYDYNPSKDGVFDKIKIFNADCIRCIYFMCKLQTPFDILKDVIKDVSNLSDHNKYDKLIKFVYDVYNHVTKIKTNHLLYRKQIGKLINFLSVKQLINFIKKSYNLDIKFN